MIISSTLLKMFIYLLFAAVGVKIIFTLLKAFAPKKETKDEEKEESEEEE